MQQLTLNRCTFIYISHPIEAQPNSPHRPAITQRLEKPMASPPTLASTAMITASQMLLLLFTCCLSQSPTAPSPPAIADCGARLLPLATCAPFVQGASPSPAPPCCGSLKQVYTQRPACLCLLLNDTTMNLSPLPINSTLALQLPDLCQLQVDISTCSRNRELPSPRSPNSQVSLGTNTSSTVAASPMVQVTPRPSLMGFGYGQSASKRLKMCCAIAVMEVIVVMTCLWT